MRLDIILVDKNIIQTRLANRRETENLKSREINKFNTMTNEIKMMSVNDMQSVYGGYDLPEVTITGDINNFERHLGEVYRDYGEGPAGALVLQYFYYKLFAF